MMGNKQGGGTMAEHSKMPEPLSPEEHRRIIGGSMWSLELSGATVTYAMVEEALVRALSRPLPVVGGSLVTDEYAWLDPLESILNDLTHELALPERVVKGFDAAGWSWDWSWDCPQHGAVAGISLRARPTEYGLPAAVYIEIAAYTWLAADRQAYWGQPLTAWCVELDPAEGKQVLSAKFLRHSLQRAQRYANLLAARIEQMQAQRQERRLQMARLCEAINRGERLEGVP